MYIPQFCYSFIGRLMSRQIHFLAVGDRAVVNMDVQVSLYEIQYLDRHCTFYLQVTVHHQGRELKEELK